MKCLPLMLLFVVFLTAGSVHGANIAIVRPASSEPPVQEALFRLRGELAALGLEVQSVELPSQHGSDLAVRASLQQLASERGLDAIIEIIGQPGPTMVDVWIFERSPRRLRVSRVALEPDEQNRAEALAIRAIEVLRSNFVEIDLAASGRPKATLAQGAQPAMPSPRRVEVLGIEAGAAFLTGTGGVAPALLPLVRLDWAASSRLLTQATLAGFGTRPTLETALGSARVDQAYALVGLCYGSASDGRVTPLLGLSAGVLRTSIEGRASSPAQGHAVGQWSLLWEASAGGRLRFAERYYLTLALHAQLSQPHLVIHFGDEVVATSGRPNLLMTLTVGAWL